MTDATKITTAMVQAAMRKQWAAPEYAILWEVAPRTGGGTRYADALIMPLWASRGFNLHGVEIKVSRADWMREAKDPSKAEAVGAYTDYWWIHTIPGVIRDVAEVPDAWGVRVWDGKRWTTMKQAEKTEAKACDRKFLASLLRRASEGAEVLAKAMATEALTEERAKIEAKIERGIADRSERKSKAETVVAGLAEGLGIDLLDTYAYDLKSDAAEIGALIKLIRETGVLSGYRSMASLANELRNAASAADDLADKMMERVQGSAFAETFAALEARKTKKRKGY